MITKQETAEKMNGSETIQMKFHQHKSAATLGSRLILLGESGVAEMQTVMQGELEVVGR